MDVMERRRAAEALRAIKRGGEGWYSLSDAVLGRPATRDEVVARLADLIDPGEDTTVDAYDLLSEEDREALRWVRGHGGLDEIRRQRRDSVTRAAYERNLAKRQRQVDESHAALRRRNRWIAELEHLLCKEMSYSLRRDAGCLAPEMICAAKEYRNVMAVM